MRLASAHIALPLLLSCKDGGSGGGGLGSSYEIQAEIASGMPTVVDVSWESELTGLGYVEYGLEGAYDQLTPTEEHTSRVHQRQLRGLKAGYTYDLRAVTLTPEGERLVSQPTSVSLDLPPQGITSFAISDYDPDQTAPGGYILVTLLMSDAAWIVIIDRDGDYVWYRQADDGLGVVTAHPIPGKDSIAWAQHDIKQESDMGGILRLHFDGSESVLTTTFQGHHDFAVLPNDRYAWISVDAERVEIEGEEMTVAADRLLETPEGSGADVTPREIFSLFSDWHELYVPCDHFYETVAGVGGYDFSHGNSLVYDEALDEFRFMTKNLDNIMFIDREDGALLYEIGGLYGDLSTEDPMEMWSHGHYSQIWDGGFTVFDNRYHSDANSSKIKEYAYDQEAGTLEMVFSWTSEGGRFNGLLGDVKRLGDTYLASWTEFGMLTEVTAEGEVVWRAETDLGTGLGRVTWLPDLYTLETEEAF